jgi:F0F1-type ATP synthase membrane subunit b/b'
MSERPLRGRLQKFAFVGMLVVTSWSVLAWAQEKPARPTGEAAREVAQETAEKGDKTTESEGPAPFNWTVFGGETPPYIAMLVNFGILAAGYYLLGKKPIAAGLQSRRDTISKEIEEAQAMKREAEERSKIYQQKLERLEEELRSARESLVQAGEAESERIVRDAEAKADRMRKDAEFLVEQELKQIRGELWRDTVEAAVAAAEDLLKKRVTSADQERLAEEYLADLGGRPRTSPAPTRSVPPLGEPTSGGAS